LLDNTTERIAREIGGALRAFDFRVDALRGELTQVQDALVDLFIEHAPVEPAGIPTELLDPLISIGLVRLSGDVLVADLDIRPYSDGANDFLIVSDSDVPAITGEEHVLGVGHASLTLASLVPREQVNRALDLGTGSGVQALHLSTHATEVVATDVSVEALRCAALSAALSGVTLDLRQGSLYEPVVGERFDLIVSNPPFVISPEKTFTYRDGGREGDDFVRELVSTADQFLNEDGWFLALANWIHVEGQDWRERLMEWIAPTQCDAWAVQREVITPEDYVNLWLTDAGLAEDRINWRAWFDEHHVTGIGFGWIVLHKSGRSLPHRRFEHLSQALEHPLGPWVADRFAIADLIADVSDEELLQMAMQSTELDLSDDLVQLTRGFRRIARVDELTAQLLRSVRPDRSVGSVLVQVAGDQPIDVESGADLVRGLLDLGALRPAVL
jgi:hypothetical protein